MKRIYTLLFLYIAILFGSLNCAWAQEIALSENFDSGSLTTNGWTKSSCHGSTDIYQSSTSYSGNYNFRFYFNTNPPQYLISKELSIPSDASEVSISLYYKAHGSSYPESFKIGYSTTTNAVASFSWLSEITSITNTTWQQYTNNSLPAGVKYIAIAYTANNKWYFYIDDIVVSYSAPTSCPKPTVLTKGTITDNSASFSWTAGGSETSWEYLCLEEGTAPTDALWASPKTANTASATVTGLSGNTKYNFYVRAVCSADDKSNPQSVAFTTPCGELVSLPTYGFEDVANGNIPECWERIVYDGSPDVYEYSSYAYNGTKSLRFYGGGSSSSQIIILPKFTNPSNLTISFWYKSSVNTSYSTYGNLQIGYMTDPSDATTFSVLTGGTLDKVSSYTQVEEFSLSGILSNDYYVAIRYSGGTSDYGSAYIDDIRLERLTSCTKPSNLTKGAVTAERATFSWTKGNNETRWEYVCLPASTTLLDTHWTSAETVNTTTATVTGLSEKTTYKFYVRAVCGGSDGNSNPISLEFTTPCTAISTFPWEYGFEGLTANTIPECWSRIPDDTNIGAVTTPVNNGSRALKLYGGTSTTVRTIVLPQFSDPLSSLTIELYHKIDYANDSYGKLTIGYVNTDGTFVGLKTITPSATYAKAEYTFPSSFSDVPANIAIRFAGATSTSYVRNLYIDDIKITSSSTTSCLTPSTLSASATSSTTATVTWTAGGTETSWKVQYSKDNWTNTSETTVNTNSCSLSNLTPATTYKVKVSALCSGSDQSDPAETLFTTACTEKSIPWSENFESMSIGNNTSAAPTCWDMINTNEGANPYAYVASEAGYYNGTKSLYFASSSSKYSYMILPAFNANTNELKVSFYYRYESSYSSNNGTIELGYITNVNNASTFTSLYTCERVTTLTQVEKVLFSTAPANSRIAFRYGGSVSDNYYASIDDINVDYLLDCSAPTGVTLTNLTATGATLSWDANDGVSSYTYRCLNGSTVVKSGTVSGTSVNLTGLTPGVEYNFYVKCACGTEESDVTSFTPICVAPTNLKFGNRTATGGRASWTASGATDVTGYEYCVVDFGEDPIWSSSAIKHGTTTSLYVDISGLAAETRYSFYVRSICGSSIYSEALKITCGPALTTKLIFYDDGTKVYEIDKAPLPYSTSSVKEAIEEGGHVFGMTDCDGYEFIGWVMDAPVIGEATSVNLVTEVPETEADHVDLYAVYRKIDNYYKKALSTSEVKSSANFIFVAEYNGNYYAMTNVMHTGGNQSGNLSVYLTNKEDVETGYLTGAESVPVTYNDGKITNVASSSLMHCTYVSSGDTKGWRITNSSGKYMYLNADIAANSTKGCMSDMFFDYFQRPPQENEFKINGATGVVTLIKTQTYDSKSHTWGLYFTPSVAANIIGTSAYSNIFIVCGNSVTQPTDYYTYNQCKIYAYIPASDTYYRSRCKNYTVLFRACGGSCSAVTISDPRRTEVDNAGVPLPTITNVKIACPSMWSWVGWAEEPVEDNTATEPTMITQDPYIPYINNKRLYGVYHRKVNGNLTYWSSYPQCDPFIVYLHPGTGKVNGSNDIYEAEESGMGKGIILPAAAFDECLVGGTWEMAGWRTLDVEYQTTAPTGIMNVNSTYKPTGEDEHLYAVYRKKVENNFVDLWSTYPMCDLCSLTVDAGPGKYEVVEEGQTQMVHTWQHKELTVNGGITLPTIGKDGNKNIDLDCSDKWTFCGWSDVKITGGAIVKPELRLPNSQYHMKTVDKDTVFAVYRRSAGCGTDSIWTSVPNCTPYKVTLYANGRNEVEGAYFSTEEGGYRKEVPESSIGAQLTFTDAMKPTIGCPLRWNFVGWNVGSPIERTYVAPTGLYKTNDKYCIRELGEAFYAVYGHKSESGTIDYWTSNPDCDPYTVKIHPCEGTINGSSDILLLEESSGGAGVTLPTPTPNCSSRGWSFAGWALGEELTTTTDISSVTLYQAGSFLPMRNNLELYAVYSIYAYKQVKNILDINTTSKYVLAIYHNYNGSFEYTDFAVSNYQHSSQSNYVNVEPISSYYDDDGVKYVTYPTEQAQWRLEYNGIGANPAYKIKSVKSSKYLSFTGYNSTNESNSQYSSNGEYYTNANAASEYFYFKISTASGNLSTHRNGFAGEVLSFELGEVSLENNGSFYSYIGTSTASCKLYKDMGQLYSSWPHCQVYTVYFDGCDGIAGAKSITETSPGLGVTLPTVTDYCSGWEFAGWATAPVYEQTSSQTFNIYPSNSNYVPEHNNTTLYAIYIQRSNKFEKISGISDVYTGANYVMVYYDSKNGNNNRYAVTGTLNEYSALSATNVNSVVSGNLQFPAAQVWTLQGMSGSYSLYNATANKYLDLTGRSVDYATLSASATDNIDIKQSDNTANTFTLNSNITGNYLTGTNLNSFGIKDPKLSEVSEANDFELYRQMAVGIWSYPCSKLLEPMRWGDGEVIVESLDLTGAPTSGSPYIKPSDITKTGGEANWDGTYTIKHDAKRGSRVRLKWGNYYYIMTIPYITTPSSVPYIEHEPTRNLAILDGATFVVDHDITLKNLFIYDGGRLIVENGTLTIDTLIMRTEGDQTAPNMILSKSASMKINSGVVFHDLRIADDRYYFFALPFNSVLGNLTYTGLLSENALPTPKYYNSKTGSKDDVYYIKYYDGVKRANDARLGRLQNNYWTPIIPWAEGAIANVYELTAGSGYIIGISDKADAHHKRILRFKMNLDYGWEDAEKEGEKVITVSPSKAGPASNNNHAGWNLIGDPYMHNYYTGSADASSGLKTGRYVMNSAGKWVTVADETQTIPYITYYQPESDDYYQVRTDNAVIKPFSAVFVQIEENNQLQFVNPINTEYVEDRMPAYRRVIASHKVDSILTGVTLRSEETEDQEGNIIFSEDNAGIIIHDDHTDEYEIGADLQKMYSENELHVYTMTGGHKLAFNAVSDETAQKPIPVGVTIPETGYYTFKFDDAQYDIEAVERLLLTDYDEGLIVDLTLEDYEFYISKGTNESRFALNAVLRKEYDVQTDVEKGGIETEPFCYDTNNGITISNIQEPSDVIVYDMTGKMIFAAKEVTDRISLNVASGIYNVVLQTAADRKVLRCVVR